MMTPYVRRRLNALACAVTVLAGSVAFSSGPQELLAQQTRCFIVACTGNVCVWQEITCPEQPAPPPGSSS
jgi:hypothetical protein